MNGYYIRVFKRDDLWHLNIYSKDYPSQRSVWHEFNNIYSEWFEIFDARVDYYDNVICDRIEFHIKFKYKSIIRPHIAECLEYMIDNLCLMS